MSDELKALVGARLLEFRDDDGCELVFDNGMSLWLLPDDDGSDSWVLDQTANRTRSTVVYVHPGGAYYEQPNPPFTLDRLPPPWRGKRLTVPRFHSAWWEQVLLRIRTAPTVEGQIDFDRWKWWNSDDVA